MIKMSSPRYIEKELFWFVIDISNIRSEKVIYALHDHLVEGDTRMDVCDKYKVNPGYLSIKLKEFHRLHEKIKTFIHNNFDCQVDVKYVQDFNKY
ncbi:adhesin biosynthesis transcription regulatory family protein [Escherichia coli]|uniref:adhesin biosynthesis transcription regulatory family protein n=1 Tax=Escherichia coli TaxID=562 RepID=UPI00215801ED|nr:adhesin biosynthesis transcription regulatory family protein [Escherichia coli]